MIQANLLQCLCGVCIEEKGDYTKPAISVTVRSGELRLRTWLCEHCMAKADDAQEANPFLSQLPTTDPLTTTTNLRFNNTC